MLTLPKRLIRAGRLPSLIILAVLVLDSVSFLLFPNDYSIRFGYIADAGTPPDAADRLNLIVQSRWPNIETRLVEGSSALPSTHPHCPPDAIQLEIQLRGAFLAVDAITNGPIDSDASTLGLRRCALSMSYSRPQNRVWGPIGGFTVVSLLLAIALLIHRVRPSPMRRAFDWVPRTHAGRSACIGVAGGLATYAACSALAAAWRVDMPGGLLSRELILATLVPAIIAVPFVEEYVFRALLLERGARAIGPWPALMLSSIAFAGLHLPDSFMLALGFVLAGIGFGLIWLRTRSLLACFIGHAVFNALASLALLWQLPVPAH